jgi:hypothetical protein
MRDLARIQPLSPLALLGSGPRPGPAGPMRLAFADVAEREQPTLLRDCFARVGVHYEFSPLRDAPFQATSRSTRFRACRWHSVRCMRHATGERANSPPKAPTTSSSP